MTKLASRPIGRLAAAGIALALLAAAPPAAAEDACGDLGPLGVWLTGGVAAVAGMGASFGSAGIITAVDDTRDYSFVAGALISSGITLGLSALYVTVDLVTGCSMVNESAAGFVWGIPITTFVVGAALPIAIWGASDEAAGEGQAAAALRQDLAWTPSLQLAF
jgi:hypothetical protein